MTDETKWCALCQRYVVPKKEFSSIGWVGLVAAVSFLAAAIFNEPLAYSLTNNTLAAALAAGVGSIMLNVLLLLVTPLVLISIVYCLYYYVVQLPRCPVCNSQDLTPRTQSLAQQWLFKDPTVLFLSLAAVISFIVLALVAYAMANRLISF